MHRPFPRFNQVLGLLVSRSQTEIHWQRGNNKSLLRVRISTGIEALPEEPIDSTFEGFTRAPHFQFDKAGYIILDGKSSSHIMMLRANAS